MTYFWWDDLQSPLFPLITFVAVSGIFHAQQYFLFLAAAVRQDWYIADILTNDRHIELSICL